MAGENERSMSVLRGAHPAVKLDKYGFPVYDTPSEAEAGARTWTQPLAINGSAHFEEAVAQKSDIFNPYDPPRFSGTDLLSGAPTDGDA